jgi:hypothetical protein
MRPPVDLKVGAAPDHARRLYAVVGILQTESGVAIYEAVVVGAVAERNLGRGVAESEKPSGRRRNRQPVRSSGGRFEATTELEWAA